MSSSTSLPTHVQVRAVSPKLNVRLLLSQATMEVSAPAHSWCLRAKFWSRSPIHGDSSRPFKVVGEDAQGGLHGRVSGFQRKSVREK